MIANTVHTRSIGALRPATKTKPRSPCLTGTLSLQPHTLKYFVEQFQESEDGVVTANLAGWVNVDKEGDQYLTVELSPKFVRKEYDNNRPNIVVMLSKWDSDD